MKKNDLSHIEIAALDLIKTTAIDIDHINSLAERQVELEGPVNEVVLEILYRMLKKEIISLATIEQLVKKVKTDLDKIKRDDLPESILNTGSNTFLLNSGMVAAVKNDISINVRKDDMPALIKQLKELVKTKVEVVVPKGQADSTRKIVAFFKTLKLKPVLKDEIHFQTLKSHIKKLREQGKSVPRQVQVFEYKNTTIK
jgi:hypothetical protein